LLRDSIYLHINRLEEYVLSYDLHAKKVSIKKNFREVVESDKHNAFYQAEKAMTKFGHWQHPTSK